MWQTTEPIELPLKALREDKLNTAERFVVTRPWSRRQNPRSQACKHRRQIPNPSNCLEPGKCQLDRQNPQPLRA
ncbi:MULTISPECIES: hypothetical protein [unclassified Microcoleus]|uniref:hypothetical protein n=1 Tax=unclassified Microcoleus TaxID=2642155 RepID=UPI002FCFF3D7